MSDPECGCSSDVDGDGFSYTVHDTCKFPKAIEIIKALLLESAWQGGKTAVRANAFLESIK